MLLGEQTMTFTIIQRPNGEIQLKLKADNEVDSELLAKIHPKIPFIRDNVLRIDGWVRGLSLIQEQEMTDQTTTAKTG